MATTDIILSLIKVFLMLVPGYILTKLRIINEAHTAGASNIITYATYPCLAISAMQIKFSWEILNNCKYVVLIFLSVTLIAMFISTVLTKLLRLPPSRAGIMAFMMVFGNTGFIGLAVLNMLMGKQAVFYGALCDSSFDLLLFTVGITLIRRSAKDSGTMGALETLKGLINPCFVGVALGLILFVLQISIPDILRGPIDTIGSCTSPLAMIVVGSHLARIRFKDMFSEKAAYLICLLKLVVAPALALVFVKILIGGSTMFGTVIVLQAAMPCAMLAVILSERYKADTQVATKGVMLSVAMSIVTIPIVAILMQHI